MTEKDVYKNGVALLEEWEDVNYCEHSFKFKDEWLTDKEVVDKLNELSEEKEDWKHNCLTTVSENSILWNEISILREQGAEPSDAFKNYLNSLKNKNNKLQGDLDGWIMDR